MPACHLCCINCWLYPQMISPSFFLKSQPNLIKYSGVPEQTNDTDEKPEQRATNFRAQIHIWRLIFQKGLLYLSSEDKLQLLFSPEGWISLLSVAEHLRLLPNSPKKEAMKAVPYLNDHRTSFQLVFHCQLGSQMPKRKSTYLLRN